MEQHRKTPRANFLDYNGGDYFITICTKGKKHYFGDIYDNEMHLSKIGKFVDLQLREANRYSENIDIPLYVVMPNHIHAVISMNCRDMPLACVKGNILQRSPNPLLRGKDTCQRHVPTLSRYINSLKGSVTKFARTVNPEFDWQTRYYDHFIRGKRDRNNISEYILNNVANWQTDCFFHQNLP